MINTKFFWFWKILKKHVWNGIFQLLVSQKHRKISSPWVYLKLCEWGKNSHEIFSSFSLTFLVQNILNFQGDRKCTFFITNLQKIFSVKKVLNYEHFFIIQGKSILYQYQSLIILSQSVGSTKGYSGNLIVLSSFI